MILKIRKYFLLMFIFIVPLYVIGCFGETSSTPLVSPGAPTLNSTSGPTLSTMPIQTLPAISSMEGYTVAENMAQAWNNDAIFGGVSGIVNANDIKTIGADGKASSWVYYFASVSAKKELSIKVNNDFSTSKNEIIINTTKTPNELSHFQGIHPRPDWKIDSTNAVQTALPFYKAKYNADPICAIYYLTNNNVSNGKVDFYWTIQFVGLKSNVMNGTTIDTSESFFVYIDPMTGLVMPAPSTIPSK